MRRELEIAPASRADVDAIHRIESASFPAPWRREFFESELVCPGRLNLVAKRNGEVVAYVFSMWIFDEMHVNKIAVDEPYRRQGIADLLMARVFAYAEEHEMTSISLEVRRSNEGAQAFYRMLGFESTYVRPRYYPDGEAAVVMTKAM